MGNFDHLKCAICSAEYGIRFGDMPPGRMTWKLKELVCSGFPSGTKTWVIRYEFDEGINPKTG